jgi:hypothetical protein
MITLSILPLSTFHSMALELRGSIFLYNAPPNMPFLMDIFDFFIPKNDIFEEHFEEPLVIFTNLKRNFQIFLNPSTFWNELATPRTLQMFENGPRLKRSGHPWSRPWLLT